MLVRIRSEEHTECPGNICFNSKDSGWGRDADERVGSTAVSGCGVKETADDSYQSGEVELVAGQ